MKIQFLPLTLGLKLATTFSGYAQFYTNFDDAYLFEAGVGIGGMNCATDLGGPKGNGGYYLNEINWQNTQLSGSIYAGVLYKQVIGLRLQATFGRVEAYDSILKGVATEKAIGRYQRNLSFRSSIKELALLGELHPLMLLKRETPPRFSPYLLGGVAVFSFDPKAEHNGEWVRLHPLRTEGQGFPEYPDRKPYALTQLNLSFGAGVRYEMSRFNLRIEVLNRRLFTDYLDDASTSYVNPLLFDKYLEPSQVEPAIALSNRSIVATGDVIKRGNQKNSDAYITINVKAGIKFGNGFIEFRRKKSSIRCKRV